MEHMVGNTGALRDILPTPCAETISRAHFTNPESLCSYVESIKAPWCRSAWDGKDAEYGVSLQQAIEMCRMGWPYGAAQATRLRDKISAANPVRRRLNAWDIGGAYPSVPRALAGDPIHMRSMRNVITRNRTITIAHHIGAPGIIASNAMCNKAAVMAAIIDAIEAASFQVELIAVSLVQASSDSRFWHETAFTVKEAGAALDIGRIAFSLGHVSMLRRLVFACRSADSFNRPITGSMGTTRDYPASDRVYILPSIRDCEGYFANEQIAATRGLQFFISELQRQGCPAFPAT